MNSILYNKTKMSILAKMLVVLMIFSICMPSIPVYAGGNDVTAYGFAIDGNYQGKWATGNLGKSYAEGEWVAFQTEIRNIDWTDGPNGLDRIGVKFDFYDNGRYFDLVRNVSVGIELLPDTHGFPAAGTITTGPSPGGAMPLETEANVNTAQRDPNNPYEHYFEGFALINKTINITSQINTAMDGGTGTETDATRKFCIPIEQIKKAYEDEYELDITESSKIVLYFQLHLSRTWLWNNESNFGGKQLPLVHAYTNPPTDKWGGYVYDETFLTQTMLGSSVYPGSSGHSYVHVITNNEGESGKKTIPLPTVEETTGSISGYKFTDVNLNEVYDEGVDIPLDGWEIYLRTDLYELLNLEFHTTTDINGYYEFTNLPYNLIWELSEGLEDGYTQTYPHAGIAEGGGDPGNVETEWYKKAETIGNMGGYTGRFDWGWLVKLAPPDHLLQTHVDFINIFADPHVVITKEGDILSKIGDEVTYTFTVTNIGNVDLTLDSIMDDKFGLLDQYDMAGGFENILSAGNTQSFTRTFTVPGGADDPFVNEVTANYVYGTTPATDAEGFVPIATWSTNLFQPVIEITKTGDELSKVGDQINYVITVTNTSSVDSPNLIGRVDDSLLGVVDADLNLASEEQIVYNLGRVVLAGDPNPLENIATVVVSPDGFPNELMATDSWSTELFEPGVMIDKTGDELSKVGDDIHYVITVTNTGSADAPPISGTVEDLGIGFSDSFSGLAYGQSVSFYPVYTVQLGDSDPFVNTAIVTASPDGFPNILEDTDTWTTELFQPGVFIEKTGDELSKVGDDIHYVITVANTGSDDSPPLDGWVDDTNIAGDKDFTFTGLTSGDHVTFQYDYTVQSGDPDPFINEATVTASPDGFDNILTYTDTWTTELFQPQVLIVKASDALSKVGDEIYYVITVVNESSADSPPLSGTVDDFDIGFSDTFTGLASGDYITFYPGYTFQPGDPDPFINTAMVTASPDGFDNILTDTASWTTDLFQPGVVIEKTGDELSKVGDDIHYVITVTNTGSVDSPPLDGWVDDTNIEGDKDFTFTGLRYGHHVTFQYDYTVQSGDPDPLVNTATVIASPEGFPNVLTDTDTWTTNLLQPGIMIEKTGDELSKVGDDIHYVITVTNTGSPDTQPISGTIDDFEIGFSDSFSGLSSGQSVSFYPVYTVQPGDPDPFVNTAMVTASPDGFTNILEDTDSWTTELFQPSITISKTGDESARVGNPIDYVIIVTNTSSMDSPTLVGTVDDSLLGEVDGNLNLAPGEQIVYNLTRTVLAGDPDPLVNIATVVVSPVGFPNILTHTDSWETDLLQPGIMIEKIADDYSVKVGDTITYTITVTNTGNEALCCVEVTDTMFGDLDDYGDYFSLEPGESKVFTRTKIATKVGTLTNVATAKDMEMGVGPVSDDAVVTVTDDPPPSRYSLSGYVFVDNNSDNSVNGDDVGYEGITVELYHSGGTTPIKTDVTDSNGKYSFSSLRGEYTVVVDPDGDIEDNQVSEYDGVLDQEVDVSMYSTKYNVNFGYIGPPISTPVIVSGYVFNDIDKDNAVDAGEKGYENIPVQLRDSSTDELIKSVLTNADGFYVINAFLDAGEYVVVNDPFDHMELMYDAGTQVSEYDDLLDEVIDITVVEGEENVFTERNFGYAESPKGVTTVLSGYVFNDLDEDNAVDAGEVGYSSVEVTIWSNGLPLLVKPTSASGLYVFDFLTDPELNGLEAGEYTITIGDTPANIHQVSEYDGPPFNKTVVLALTDDTEAIANINFGFKDNTVPPGEETNVPLMLFGLFLITSGIVIRRKSYNY